ncbi:type IV toxin-antitoxin system AbiEi family antitoxin domain-containing protein [Promicromonospora soli]
MVISAPVDYNRGQWTSSGGIDGVPKKIPVPQKLLTMARDQGGLVSSAQCDGAGVGSSMRRNLVTGGSWQRVTRGVFDTGDVRHGLHPYDRDRLRSAWTALLANRRAIAAGACALVLHGVKGLPRRITPEATFPGGAARKSRDGITFRQYGTGLETVRLHGREVVSVAHALVQALPTLTRDQAVACLDSALSQDLIQDGHLAEIRRLLKNRKGSLKVISWLPLADGRAESPTREPRTPAESRRPYCARRPAA